MSRSLNDPWFVIILATVIVLFLASVLAVVTGGKRKPTPPMPEYPLRWDDTTADRLAARAQTRRRR
jgi:hypothetical protein